jgi:hypothetical protein
VVRLYKGGGEVSSPIKFAIILAQLNNYQFFCSAVVLFVARRKEGSLVPTGYVVFVVLTSHVCSYFGEWPKRHGPVLYREVVLGGG